MAQGRYPKEIYADDSTEGVGLLFRLRLPWLILGLIGGAFATILVSRFEVVLAENVKLAFFLPLIVYMSDAVGTQTETIYVRNLGKGTIKFGQYLLKEFLLGLGMGAVLGGAIGLFAYIWLQDVQTAWTVGLAMFASVTTAPLIALIIPLILYKEHTDPALGAGPFTTVIQDIISLSLYFAIASFIIFT